jgi:hypothetical protein
MSRDRVGLLLPVLTAGCILAVLDPRLLLSPTTPAGGDLGLHVFPFSSAVDHLFSSGRLTGWSDGWFGGFPLFYFYFPLPAALVALFAPVVGFPVALKLVASLGLLALPFCGFALARALGFGRLESGVASAVGGGFVFMESFWHLGGNVYSTMTGEFAFSISLALSILYVALVTRAMVASRRGGPIMAAVLAATALSHVLTTLAAVLASIPGALWRRSRPAVLTSWWLGFALAGVWALPFLVRAGEMGHLPWIPGTSPSLLVPVELWFVLPGAVLGLHLLWRSGPRALPLLTLMGASGVVLLVPSGLEMRDRLLPFWYFGIHLLAGLAVGRGIETFLETRSAKALATAVGVGGLLAALFVLRDVSTVRSFAATSLEGYEAQDAWPMHERLIEAVADLPPGRVLWQSDSTLAALGSVNAPALLPYWSADHPTLHGLLVESSRSAPFTLTVLGEVSPAPAKPSFRVWPDEARYDLEAGVAHMAFMGVRYYVTFTDRATATANLRPDLRPLRSDGDFAVFEVDARPLVTPARSGPTVHAGPDFDVVARSWFHRRGRLTEWLVESGPPDWPRATGDPVDWPPAPATASHGLVTAIVEDGDRIQFRTSAVGVPHLVRVSFFPNWRARGAEGPYRAAPSFMVVVPTQETVTLSFEDTWVEWTGRLLTGTALAWLLIQAVRRRRARNTASGKAGGA